MLPLCYICLRSDVKFQMLGTLPGDQAELISFCDQLCDYNFQDFFYQFCPKCLIKLKKCLEFKNRCKLASNIIKSWKETSASERVSLHELYKHMPLPQSQLNLPDGNNLKAHFLQEDNSKMSEQTNKPIFVTVDSPNENNIDITHIKQEVLIEIETEPSTPKDVLETNFMFDVEIKKEICDEESSMNDVNGLSGDEFGSRGDENGSSGDETYVPQSNKINKKALKKKRTKIKESPLEKIERRRIRQREHWRMKAAIKRQNKLPESERFKECLREKLQNINVKDKGLIDSIINCLDIMPPCYLRECGRAIGTGPISASELNKLSEVYAHYVEIASAFDIDILSDNVQAQAEFDRRKEYPEYLKSEHRCEICFTGYYKSQKHLDYHYRTLHNESHPHVCELCKWRFKTNTQLTWHYTKTHRTVYRCKRCPDVFNNRECMEQHFRKHEGLKYTCEICSKELNHRCQYYAHMKKHRQNVPSLHCEFCAFSTHSLSGMTLHKNRVHSTHIGDRCYKCDVCDKGFISRAKLNEHVRGVHLNIRQKRKKLKATETDSE